MQLVTAVCVRILELLRKIYLTTLMVIEENPWFVFQIISTILNLSAIGIFIYYIAWNKYRNTREFARHFLPVASNSLSEAKAAYQFIGVLEEMFYYYEQMKIRCCLSVLTLLLSNLQYFNFSK